MPRAAMVDDILVVDGFETVQHVAAGEAAGIAEADHDLALLMHVVEIHAGRGVLVGQKRLTGHRIGVGHGSGERERGAQAKCERR